jgi:hypothetical protein
MEKISNEKLDRLIKYVLPAIKLSFNNQMEPDLRSALEELKARREVEATCKESLQVEEMIKSLESISGTFLLASVNKNDKIEGRFSGDESKLLLIVDFIFDKLEEASNGEITKRDLIGELLSAEGEE